MATLAEVVNSARFTQLREAGLTERIAAVLNAPEELTEANPNESPPLIFAGSPTIADLTGILTDAEVVQFARDELKITGLADTAGTPEATAAAAALTRYMQSVGTYDASVWHVARVAIENNRPDMVQTLLSLVVMAGMMTQERAAELAGAMLIPDPAWSATITTWGQSESDIEGWGFVAVEQVAQAIQ